MKTISTEDLKKLIDGNDDFALINVLPAEHFQQKHIPGSVNHPIDQDDFLDAAGSYIGDEDRTVIVYCANTECQASPKAAQMLEEAGYRDVRDYEGGVEAWESADLPLEGSAVESR